MKSYILPLYYLYFHSAVTAGYFTPLNCRFILKYRLLLKQSDTSPYKRNRKFSKNVLNE